MEAQSLRPLLLLSILLLLSPFFATTYAAETGKPLITETCKKTQYPEDCVRTLESDPRSSNADLPTLGRISLEVSSSKVKQGYPVVRAFIFNASDYPTWSEYSACAGNYNLSIANLDVGLKLFDGKEYKNALSKVVAVNSAIVFCNSFNLGPISQLNRAVITVTNNTGTILSLLS